VGAQASTSSILTSTDGVAWTAGNSGNNHPVAGIAYGNGQFVGMESGGWNSILTSPDGATWTTRGSAVTSDTFLTGIAYGNGSFVITQFMPGS
jgi:hypothetical protein